MVQQIVYKVLNGLGILGPGAGLLDITILAPTPLLSPLDPPIMEFAGWPRLRAGRERVMLEEVIPFPNHKIPPSASNGYDVHNLSLMGNYVKK
jgi:hypothetical protein